MSVEKKLNMICDVVPDKSVQSVVSFDQGGEWVPLRKPADSKCVATAEDPHKVKRGNWGKTKQIFDLS